MQVSRKHSLEAIFFLFAMLSCVACSFVFLNRHSCGCGLSSTTSIILNAWINKHGVRNHERSRLLHPRCSSSTICNILFSSSKLVGCRTFPFHVCQRDEEHSSSSSIMKKRSKKKSVKRQKLVDHNTSDHENISATHHSAPASTESTLLFSSSASSSFSDEDAHYASRDE